MRVMLVLGTSGGGVGRHVRALERDLPAVPVPAGGTPLTVSVAGPAQTREAFGYNDFHVLDVADRPRPRADAAAVRRLRRLTRDVDAVHAHGLRAGALAVLANAGRRRPAVVVTLHNALVGGGRTAAVHAVLERLVARGADAVLVVSGDLGARMRALGARQVERALVPAPPRPATPGVTAADVRARLGVPDGTALAVTVGRLAPQKGLGLLLDAAALLAGGGAAERPVLVAVAGDGPLREQLQARIDAERLPVHLLGHRDDVPDLVAAADVVLSTSVWEGQPLNVQEALRAGAAVVATDVGGTREVTGDAADLVPYGDAAALAAAVRRVVDDADHAADLRRRAAERADGLPTDADAAAQVAAVLRTVTG